MSDIKPICETCDHFNKIDTDDDGNTIGDCRRYAPRPITYNAMELAGKEISHVIPFVSWSRVWSDSWCGEHSKLKL